MYTNGYGRQELVKRQWFYQGRYAMFLESDLFPSLLRVDAIKNAVQEAQQALDDGWRQWRG